MKKIAFIDLDGVLFNGVSVTPECYATLQYLKSQNYLIYICSRNARKYEICANHGLNRYIEGFIGVLYQKKWETIKELLLVNHPDVLYQHCLFLDDQYGNVYGVFHNLPGMKFILCDRKVGIKLCDVKNINEIIYTNI